MPNTPCGADSGARASADVLTIAPGDVVTAQDDEIGTLDRERAHRLRDIVVGDQAAAVHVGDEANAETRERGRQSDDTDSGARHFKLMALVEKSVSTAAGDDADAAG